MSNVLSFRSRKKVAAAIGAGLLSLADARHAGSIGGIRDLFLELDRINTHTRILILQVADETAQQQLMANANNIDVLIRVAREQFEDILQTLVVPTPA